MNINYVTDVHPVGLTTEIKTLLIRAAELTKPTVKRTRLINEYE